MESMQGILGFALHSAVESGNSSIVRVLVKDKANVNVKDDDGKPPIHYAVKNCYIEIVEILIDAGANVNAEDNAGITPLHLAIYNSNIIKLLIKSGAYVNIKDKDGKTLIHYAVGNYDPDIVELLIDAGVNINAQDNLGITPLHLAVGYGYSSIVKLLINEGADVNIPDKNGKTPVNLAIENYYPDVIESLIDVDANVDVQSDTGMTLLHIAVDHGNSNIVRLLIQNKAKINIQDEKGEASIHLAVKKYYIDIIELLIEANANLDIQDKNGITPMHLAAGHGYISIVRLLIKNRAKINIQDKDRKKAPIHLAIDNYHSDIVKVLVDAKANLNLKDKDYRAPLHLVANYGYSNIARLLLKDGADIDIQNKEGEAPIHLAIKTYHIDIVELLTDARANLNIKNKDGITPLILATNNGYSSMVNLFINAGVNLDIQDKNGKAAIHLAIENYYPDIVELLIDARANLNVKDKDKRTPIQIAMDSAHIDIVKLLVDAGVYINEKDKVNILSSARKGMVKVSDSRVIDRKLLNAVEEDRLDKVRKYLRDEVNVNVEDANNNHNTPLHYAVNNANAEIISLLLEQKADISIKNKNDQTPLELARSLGNKEIICMLEKHLDELSCLDVFSCTTPYELSTDLENREIHAPLKRLQRESREDLINKENVTNSWNNYSSSSIDSGLDSTPNTDHIQPEKNKTDPVMKSIKELELELEVGELCVDREISEGRQEVEGLNKRILGLTKDLQAEKAKVLNLEEKLRNEQAKLSDPSKDLKYEEQKVADLKKINSININKIKRALSVELLIDARANLNVKDKDKRTPIQIAMDSAHIDIVKLLVDAGVYINEKDKVNILSSARKGMVKVSDSRVIDRKLLNAVEEDRLDKVRKYLRDEVNVNVEDANNNHNTPLHYAVNNANAEIISLLLEQKADISIKNKNDQTPLELARSLGNKEIICMLEKHLDESTCLEIVININDSSCTTPSELSTNLENNESHDNLLLSRDQQIQKAKINIYNTKGDGNCFFHAVFGDHTSGVYEVKKAAEMRNEWHQFLSKFTSLNDSNMPTPLKVQLKKIFNFFLNNPEDLTNRAEKIKELVYTTVQRIKETETRTCKLINDIIERFVNEKDFRDKIYLTILETRLKENKNLPSIQELLNDKNMLGNEIRNDLKSCTLKFYPEYSEEQYNKYYDTEDVANSFLTSDSIYKNYLEAIQSNKYYVFFEEIPVLVSLANITVKIYCHNGDKYIFKPNKELLAGYESNHELWGREKEAIVYHKINHFSRARYSMLGPRHSSTSRFNFPQVNTEKETHNHTEENLVSNQQSLSDKHLNQDLLSEVHDKNKTPLRISVLKNKDKSEIIGFTLARKAAISIQDNDVDIVVELRAKNEIKKSTNTENKPQDEPLTAMSEPRTTDYARDNYL